MYPFQGVKQKVISITTDTNAYSSGDVVGGLLSLEIAGANKCGAISKIVLVDTAGTPVEGAYTLHIYRSAPATIADDAAFALLAGEIITRVGKVAIAADDYVTETNGSYAEKDLVDTPIYFECGAAGRLYFYLEAGGTHNYGAADKLAMRVDYVEII